MDCLYKKCVEKMGKEEVTGSGNIEIRKRKFIHCKKLFLLENVDFDNIMVASVVSSGFYWLQR